MKYIGIIITILLLGIKLKYCDAQGQPTPSKSCAADQAKECEHHKTTCEKFTGAQLLCCDVPKVGMTCLCCKVRSPYVKMVCENKEVKCKVAEGYVGKLGNGTISSVDFLPIDSM